MNRSLRHDDSVHREEDRSVRFDDLASIFRSEFDGDLALVNSSLDKLLGKRRKTKEKVSVMLEPSFV